MKNRIHGVLAFLQDMKAMILAAGQGMRLRPLTNYVPKPLVPILNVPVVVRTLRYLRAWGIREVVINLHHDGAKMRQALGDGSQLGMGIEYSTEKDLMGTAGGIKKAQARLRGGTFVVINSDVLTGTKLSEVIAYHRSRRAMATLVLREDPRAEQYGALAVDASGRIVRLRDLRVRSEAPQTVAMFTGIHVMEAEFLDAIPAGRPCGIIEETYPLLLKRDAPVFGYLDASYWADIGRPAWYLAAHMALLEGELHSCEPGTSQRPMKQIGRGSSVSSLSRVVPPVRVGECCRIEEGAQVGARASVGNNCILGRDCMVEESVVWDNVTVGAGARVDNAIIASNTAIPDGAHVSRQVVTPGMTAPIDKLEPS